MLFESGGWAGEPADLLKADVNNPRGYGERRDIVRLHEEWLGSLGASWSLPPNHAALTDIDVERRDHASSLMTSVSSQVPTGRTLVLKDPRLALFVATWLEVAPAARVVLPIRHPIEVAASLWKRDQIPTAHGVALWEKYTRETLAALGERDVVVVNFTALAQLGRQRSDEVGEAVHQLMTAVRLANGTECASATGVFEGELVQHSVTTSELAMLSRTCLPPSAAELWERLSAGDVITAVAASALTDGPPDPWWALDLTISQWKAAGATLARVRRAEALLAATTAAHSSSD